MRIIGVVTICVLLLAALVGCSESTPLKIGFIGGTSGKLADLGVAGRNGVILAVEQRNKAGGVNGRSVELLLNDDKQTPEVAKRITEQLVASQVDAILGPMTSSMAVEIAPIAERSGTLMMGITVTTNGLSGKDDHFFRVLSPTVEHVTETAQYLRSKKGTQRVSVIYDLSNKSYSESWLVDFSAAFRSLGGEVIQTTSFYSSNQVNFAEIAEEALSKNPDRVVLVVNSVDAALLAKQLRTMNPEIPLATSEWSGTERLIELGGRYVEGTVVPQYFDRDSQDPAFQAFVKAYVDRFGHSPGFPGLVGYDATNVVLDGLAKKQDDETLKQALLRIGTFTAIAGEVTFDSFGEAKSKTYLTEIIDGQFRLGTSL